MAPTQIVPINEYSDGDPSHRPNNPQWTVVDPPLIYLDKLATGWMEHQGKGNKSKSKRTDIFPDFIQESIPQDFWP